MTKCPACRSVQVVFRTGPLATSCYYCGTSWIEQDGVQTEVRAPEPPVRAGDLGQPQEGALR
jgi:ribosomal protein S27E